MNHIDNDKSNNHESNLEWCTTSENAKHEHSINLNRKSPVLRTSKPVRTRSRGSSDWVVYASIAEAAYMLNADKGNISACARGRISHAGGYAFGFQVELENEEWRDVTDDMLRQLSDLNKIYNKYDENCHVKNLWQMKPI